MKWFKWTVITIVTFIILATIAIFILINVINPNQYKTSIEQTIFMKTGRQLVINGDLSWSIFPSVAIKIQDGLLSNPTDFKAPSDTFLQWKSASAKLDLWKLLSGNISLEELTVQQAKIYLVKNKQGRVNWLFGDKIPSKTQAENKVTMTDKSIADSDKKMPQFLITKIQINQSALQYQNLQDNQKISLTNLNFTVTAPPVKNTEIKVKGGLSFNNYQGTQGTSNIEGMIKINVADLTFDQLRLGVNFQGKNRIVYSLQTSLSGLYRWNQQQLKISKMKLALNQEKVGNISQFMMSLSTGEFEGNYEANQLNVEKISTDFNIKLPSVENKTLWNNIAVKTYFKGDKVGLKLENIHSQVDDANIKGHINIVRYAPLEIQPNLQIDKLKVSDFMNLKGAKLTLNDVVLSGGLSKTLQGLDGKLLITSKTALLQGIDLNKISVDFQKFLASLASADHIGRNFQNIRRELLFLNVIGPNSQIYASNGRETKLYNLDIQNIFLRSNITMKHFQWRGEHFYLQGEGVTNWQRKNLDYKFKIYVYNPENQNLAEDQKIYIPYALHGQYGNLISSVDQQNLERQLQPLIQRAIQNVIQQKAGQLLNNLFK